MTYLHVEEAKIDYRTGLVISNEEYAQMLARDQHNEDLEADQAIQDYYDQKYGY